jgi:hypothetical protein
MLYFLALWKGTRAGVTRITNKVRNFFWSGIPTRARAPVSWKLCCQCLKEGRLNMVDPLEALTFLMAKWVVSTLEQGISNF